MVRTPPVSFASNPIVRSLLALFIQLLIRVIIEAVRDRIGAANIRPTSWYRTIEEQQRLVASGTTTAVTNSLHQLGLAIDLTADDQAVLEELARRWRAFGFDAVLGNGYVHLELDGQALPLSTIFGTVFSAGDESSGPSVLNRRPCPDGSFAVEGINGTVCIPVSDTLGV